MPTTSHSKAVLGSIEARGIRKGQFVVTGTLSAYFENEELLEMYLDGTATDLTFKLGGASSKNYVFNIPNLKFQNGRVVAGGNVQDVLTQMEFTGLYDSGIGGTLEITRTHNLAWLGVAFCGRHPFLNPQNTKPRKGNHK